MKKYLLILILFFSASSAALAQGNEVTGVVKDNLGEPLAGVTVAVKDVAGVGTMTDKYGSFKIKAESHNFLMFSFIGYEKIEVLVGTQKVVNVELQESKSNVFTDLVVTSSGPKRKITQTGSVTNVNIADLVVTGGNLSNALAGNVQGIIGYQASGAPGENLTEFWIRGISTFGAGKSALILVDGFERPLNEVSVEDIADMVILKDASATAIYGSRGANGVVLIETKKGAAGKVNINTKFEYTNVTRTRTPELADGNVYAELYNEAKITRNLEPRFTPAELDIFKYQLDPDLYPNVDWMKVMLKPSSDILRASVNVSGGGSTARYFISGSYLDEGGMYKSDKSLKDYKTNANLNRYNYRTNVDVDITKTTLLSLGVSGFLQKKNEPGFNNGDIWYSIMGQSKVTIPVMYSNGKVPTYGTGNRTNPYVLATQTGYKEEWTNVAQVNATLNQSLTFITKGLKFVGRFGYDTKNYNVAHRRKWPEQFYAERVRDRQGELVMIRKSTEGLMTYAGYSEGERLNNIEAEIHYNREFNNAHNVGAMIKGYRRNFIKLQSQGEVPVFDAKDAIPRRNEGISGVVNYAYKFRYLAEFNFGYTGSENFKKGHRYGFFPAVAVGWNIGEEKFVKDNLKWLDMFKLRYSYGKVGNDNVGYRFPYLGDISDRAGWQFADIGFNNYYSGLHYSKVPVDNLTWEIASKHNFGIDIQVLKSKGTLTVDIFKDTRTDIYMERKYLPWMTGLQNRPMANVGEMESKGIDGSFSYSEKIGQVNFTFRGNMTYAKTQVIEFDEEANSFYYKMTQGYRWDQARGLIALGLFKDYQDIKDSPTQHFGDYMPGDVKYKDLNGDGIINGDDECAIGATRIPNLIYGLGVSARWKSFDINIHFQGAGKSTYYVDGTALRPFSEGDWGNILTDVVANRWISREISGTPDTERTDAKYPRLTYGWNNNNYQRSTYWMRDGRYLRLKTVEIGYNLPNSFANKLAMSNVRVFLIGSNLAVWDKLKMWDPELTSGNGEKYPIPKSITAGINVNF